jgi:hypothetical protein
MPCNKLLRLPLPDLQVCGELTESVERPLVAFLNFCVQWESLGDADKTGYGRRSA